MLIRDIPGRNAEYKPEADAIVQLDGPTLSWKELSEQSNRFARALVTLGLEPGDRLAILAPNCPEYIEFFFACAKTGVAGAPVNIRQTASELVSYLSYIEPRAVLVHADYAELGAAVTDQLPTLEFVIGTGEGHGAPLDLGVLMAAEDPSAPGIEVPGDAIYQLCPTSGTTGTVKGAIMTQDSAIASVNGWAMEYPVTENSTYLQMLSLFFNSGGPASGVPAAFLKGGRMVLIPSFEPLSVLRCINDFKVTASTMVPTMMRMLLDHPRRAEFDLSSFTHATMGGAPVSAALVEEVRATIGPVVFPMYAMAETASSGLILRQEQYSLVADRTLLPTGRPQANMNVRVVGDDGTDVPGDGTTTGEVWLKGPAVSPGYFRKPEDTAACRVGDWLKTGDIAVVDEYRIVTLVDRKKDIIITGGINVVSREVEEALASHPAVLEAAVIGVPHEQWGEAIHAVIVLREGEGVSDDALRAHALEQIAKYKCPQSYEYIPELPRTATGKVLKRELRARHAAPRIS